MLARRTGSLPCELRLVATKRSSHGRLPVLKTEGSRAPLRLARVRGPIPGLAASVSVRFGALICTRPGGRWVPGGVGHQKFLCHVFGFGRVRSRDLPDYEQVASRVSYSWSRPNVAHTGGYLFLKLEVTGSNPTSDRLAKTTPDVKTRTTTKGLSTELAHQE